MMNFILRLVLFMLGLVFAASLAVAVLLLAAVWGVRSGWARLTGRPVTPWVMRFDPGAGFNRFRAASQPAEPSAGDVVSARALGESSERPVRVHGVGGGVTDVQPKSAP